MHRAHPELSMTGEVPWEGQGPFAKSPIKPPPHVPQSSSMRLETDRLKQDLETSQGKLYFAMGEDFKNWK